MPSCGMVMLLNGIMGCLTNGTESDFLLWGKNEQLVGDSAYRLPLTTKPLEYWLELNPNMTATTFSGQVKIEIIATVDTNEITLHSKGLDIRTVSVVNYNESIVIESTYDYKKEDNPDDTFTITTKQQLQANTKYKVTIAFAAQLLKNNPFGFVLYWKTKYDRANNTNALLADTLFEPFFARKSFPCYDEIQYRTPFTISIAVSDDESAISNMPAARDAVSDPKYQSKKLITFGKTEPIPAHMVTYTVFNKGVVNIHSKNKMYFVWTMEEYVNEAKYALLILSTAAEKMNKLFTNVAYRPKIDLVIDVHQQMWFQSKDNPWGSMLYVGNYYLCGKTTCPASYQQNVIVNVIRQVQYKWFGNYVSAESWNYLWLKDGFAKYFAFELTRLMKPESVRMSQIHASLEMQSIINDDGRIFFDPITRQGDSSMRKIFEMYKHEDYKFYNGKAALIIRMLEHIVGKSIFVKAVERYLTHSHEYNGGLVKPTNLWRAFERQLEEDKIDLHLPEGESLSSIMDGWTESVGYPLVTAKKVQKDAIFVKQEPYGGNKKNTSQNSKWVVPISVTTENEANFVKTSPVAWCDDEIVVSNQIKPNEWYVVNVQNTGYYRVNYDENNWKLLMKQLMVDPTEIHVSNRSQLISDSHQLAIDGIIDVKIPITLSYYLLLGKEKDPLVWMVAFRSFKRFYFALDEHTRPSYQEYFMRLLMVEYRRIGFKPVGDDRITRMWQNELLNFLCWTGDNNCVTAALKMYQDNKNNLTNIDPDMQFAVFCTVFRHNTDTKPLKNLIAAGEIHNAACLTDLLHRVKHCAAFPRGRTGLVLLYETLFDRMKKGENRIVKSILNELSTQWDTTLLLLKRIEIILSEWRTIFTDDSEYSIMNSFDTEVLAALVRHLRGKINGAVEMDVLERLIDASAKNNGRFSTLENALKYVHENTGKVDRITDSRKVEKILNTVGYTNTKWAKGAANESFFDELRDLLPENDITGNKL